MNHHELQYYIAIGLIPGIGSILAKRLIEHCGNAEAVFKSPVSLLQKIPGIGPVLTREISTQQVLKTAEEELRFIDKYKIDTYCYNEPAYPERLRQCEDGPVVFFAKGKVDFNHSKLLSVVGTRHATAYGTGICAQIIGELAERGHRPVIVSGLAYGIDICAHRAALEHRLPTIVVMGTGLNRIYPAAHTATARQIIEQDGALVSDFTSGTVISRQNFLRRNRIIAGLSDATLVVESHAKGGALVTADIAASYNRDTLAVPGRLGDKASEGCNELIRLNKAALVQSAQDIEYALGWEAAPCAASAPGTATYPAFKAPTAEEELLITAFTGKEQLSIDALCAATRLPAGQLSALLLNMELKGLLKRLPGKHFSLKSGN